MFNFCKIQMNKLEWWTIFCELFYSFELNVAGAVSRSSDTFLYATRRAREGFKTVGSKIRNRNCYFWSVQDEGSFDIIWLKFEYSNDSWQPCALSCSTAGVLTHRTSLVTTSLPTFSFPLPLCCSGTKKRHQINKYRDERRHGGRNDLQVRWLKPGKESKCKPEKTLKKNTD